MGASQVHAEVSDLDASVLERGWKICERLGFPSRLMKLAADVKFDASGRRESALLQAARRGTRGSHGALSRSDKKLIHLARGLIYNPEVPTRFL